MGKRIFDFVLSLFLLMLLILPMFFLWLITTIVLQRNGLFFQKRIGQYGIPFTLYKFKTLSPHKKQTTKWGTYLRKSKLDELPQLVNILKGDMSFVGPRPDIPGYYDQLQGENRKILELKPGITSEAALTYINEEQLLASKKHPLQYNDEVIFPEKIKMNLHYYHTRSFLVDLKILVRTIQKLV